MWQLSQDIFFQFGHIFIPLTITTLTSHLLIQVTVQISSHWYSTWHGCSPSSHNYFRWIDWSPDPWWLHHAVVTMSMLHLCLVVVIEILPVPRPEAQRGSMVLWAAAVCGGDSNFWLPLCHWHSHAATAGAATPYPSYINTLGCCLRCPILYYCPRCIK